MGVNRIAIATNALGKSVAGHSIIRKLQAASDANFEGVEVAIECLEAHANTAGGYREDNMRWAATDIRSMASNLSLTIVALNPFAGYDALREEKAVESRLKEAQLWLDLCKIMQASILQIPSCTYPVLEADITQDYGAVAGNLKTLCELAHRYEITVAYEAPAWGIHINRWQQTRDIALLVNAPNIKLCLDTYHIAAKEVGDPFNTSSPVCHNQLPSFYSSLEELKATVKPADIGYFQLSDATVADPEQKGYPVPDLNQPPYMTQSRNCRMFPCEPAKYGGTLPALEVARAVFATGYDGWVSMEVFHTDLYDPRPTVPEEWANRAMASWKEVVRRCGLRDHCFEKAKI